MKLGVLTVPLYALPLQEALAYLKKLGVEQVELGAGGNPGTTHCNPRELLGSDAKLHAFQEAIEHSGLSVSALGCHGNAVHPNPQLARRDHEDFELAVQLAAKLGVEKVITFSGCPGDSPAAKHANWVTCAWPEEYAKVLKYQWKEVLIPYWKQAAAYAKSYGVKICLEMHPGFCVYNPETLLRLRDAVGGAIGANLDPSHLFWQGIDPVAAIRALGPALYHFHAKDTFMDTENTAVNGVLDTKHYADVAHRSWTFRTVGYGHGPDVWNAILSQLVVSGYHDAISIEHEDGLMSVNEGLEKAVDFLRPRIIRQKAGEMWWA